MPSPRVRHLVGVALMLLLTLAVLSFPQPVAARALAEQGAPIYFVPGEILSYEQVHGQSGWIQNSARRFMSAIWQFNDDGSFAFAPSYDVRDDLYPLHGRYQVRGSMVYFSAARSSQLGYSGSASASIEGSIDFGGRTPVVTMYWINSSGMAASVYGTGYASANSSAYQIQATLVQAR
jgi:hypothetical protein